MNLVHTPEQAASVPVIPAPVAAVPAAGAWQVRDGARVAGPDALAEVLVRFADDVYADTGIELLVSTDAADADVRVEQDAAGLTALAPAAGVRADGSDHADERYRLQVSDTGVLVHAAAPEAVHRALTTLRQLIAAAAATDAAEVPAVRISDAPRFAWRGLSLDVARTYHDVETVKRVIDMCSLHKLNVLHLHLTDDQGWRFEVPGWPLLAEVGGAGALGERPGGHYTRADVADLVGYATERFVTIVPEVDMPGHTAAAFRAYPELAPAPSPAADQAAAVGIPIGHLDLARADTRRFVTDVLAAVAEQFPTTAYIHIGADEAFGMPDADHAAFVEYAVAAVKRSGRRAIGWQEAARGPIGPEELVQYWIEPTETQRMLDSGLLTTLLPAEVVPLIEATMRTAHTDVPRALEHGARVIVSPTTRLYFDRPHADEGADEEQESRRTRLGLPFYPPTSLRDMVEWDPIAETPGVTHPDQLAGVEAAVWCETVANRDDLEALLLPRLPGAAERAWASAPTVWDDYVARLAAQTPIWDRRGWAWFRPAFLAADLAAV
jgi:hexosaminidase